MSNKKIGLPEDGTFEIIELQSKYHIIICHGVGSKIFWSKLQGIKLLLEYFEGGHITATEIVSFVDMITDLTIPFMWHPKDRKQGERVGIESDEQMLILLGINEARVKEEVLLTKKPKVGVHGIPGSDDVEAYILTPVCRSGFFDNFEDGKQEIEKMIASYRIEKADGPILLKQVEEIFGGNVFQGDGFKIVLN